MSVRCSWPLMSDACFVLLLADGQKFDWKNIQIFVWLAGGIMLPGKCREFGSIWQSFSQFERLLCALYVQLFGLFTSASAWRRRQRLRRRHEIPIQVNCCRQMKWKIQDGTQSQTHPSARNRLRPKTRSRTKEGQEEGLRLKDGGASWQHAEPRGMNRHGALCASALLWQMQQAKAGCRFWLPTNKLTNRRGSGRVLSPCCLVLGPGRVPGGTFGSNRMLHATFQGGVNVTPLDGPRPFYWALSFCCLRTPTKYFLLFFNAKYYHSLRFRSPSFFGNVSDHLRKITIERLTVHLKSNLSAAPKATHVPVFIYTYSNANTSPAKTLPGRTYPNRGSGEWVGVRGRAAVITATRVH